MIARIRAVSSQAENGLTTQPRGCRGTGDHVRGEHARDRHVHRRAVRERAEGLVQSLGGAGEQRLPDGEVEPVDVLTRHRR